MAECGEEEGKDGKGKKQGGRQLSQLRNTSRTSENADRSTLIRFCNKEFIRRKSIQRFGSLEMEEMLSTYRSIATLLNISSSAL